MNTDRAQTQYDRMTTTPVSKLVLSLGIPTTVSALITNLYNIVDTYFVSGIGTSASGATGIVFALMGIIQAFGFMFGQGAGSNISRLLGAKKVDRARNFAATSFFLALFAGAVVFVAGTCFMTPLMRLFGSTESILPYAKGYCFFILLSAPAMASSCVMNNILRYEGKAVFAMFGLGFGGIANIFGDYVLIRILHMGVMGAGLSTALSQYAGMGILYLPFATGKVQSRLSLRYFTRDFTIIGSILGVGAPSMIRQGLNSISVMVLNLCAGPYGDAAIAAMSIVSRVTNLLFCVALGVSQGFQPVSGFNYGARKYDRVKKAFLFLILFNTGLMLLAGVFGGIWAPEIIRVFRDDEMVIQIGAVALRYQCLALPFMPSTMAANMLFQSTGHGAKASVVSSYRSGVLFIPLIIILRFCMGLTGIEIAQPISDCLAILLTAPMTIGFLKRMESESR